MVNVAIVVLLTILSTVEPIIVTYGTNQGPIVPPPPPKSASAESRTQVVRSPAPVREDFDDVPNPSTYRPLVPHQYRTKLLSYQPPSNLIFGTPLDRKYTPALEKYEIYRKQQAVGVDYRGPQFFVRQPYEIAEALKKSTRLQPSVRYIKAQYYDGKAMKQQGQIDGKYVPQIGILHSSGVRYYVPQINYYQDDQENSVYDQNDQKYVYQQ